MSHAGGLAKDCCPVVGLLWPSATICRMNASGHDINSAEPPPLNQRRAWTYPPSVAIFLCLVVGVFAADQALKYLAFENVAPQPIELKADGGDQVRMPRHEVPVIDGVLSLRLATNEGAVFGLWQGAQMLFIGVSIVAAIVMLVLFALSPANAVVTHLALALILAGDLGNLYDRLVYAQVRDMLWLFPGTGLWPWIFNLADAALMLGVGLVLTITWRSERRPRTAESA